MELNNNAIDGALPSEIGALSLLGELVDFHCLWPEAQISLTEWLCLSFVEDLSLQNLALSETIPVELGRLTNAGA